MHAAVLQMSNSIPSEEDEAAPSLKESTNDSGNAGRRENVPTGLSALLSAVTMQLNESYEEECSSNVPRSSNTFRVVSADCDSAKKEATGGTDTQKSTPTIVPEIAKQMPFPESLMTLLMNEDNANVLTFLPDGKFFAIKCHDFTDRFLEQYFSADTFESFCKELEHAGFCHIKTDLPGIKVFRHKLFNKGDWRGCEQLVIELEQQGKKQSLSPNIGGPESTSLDDHCTSKQPDTTFKRRLSPAHAQRVEGETESLSQKFKIQQQNGSTTSPESDEALTNPPDPVRLLRNVSDKDYADVARNIAFEKILCNGQKRPSTTTAQKAVSLEQQAVEGATRTIVTDAIESLLRDEDHTRETYQKHEQDLSKSSVPGLVPISKQLFALESKETGENAGESLACEKKAKDGAC